MLRAVYGSMGHDDLIIYTDKPDSEVSRHFFDFSHGSGTSMLSPNHRFIFDLLDVDESPYDVEMGYNPEHSSRYVRVRLKAALTIKFIFSDGERSVSLEKGDAILLLRIWHLSTSEMVAMFDDAGFSLLQSSTTRDRQYLLTISGIGNKPGLEL